ncbi:anti-sigma factor family protein [Stenotrophomonas humi]
MSTIDEERLMAWLDGELDDAAAAEVERAVAADPVLSERVRHERLFREQLGAAFAPVLDEPVPERLLATLGMAEDATTARPTTDAVVVPLRPRSAARQGRGWRWPEWTALAASVLLGVLFGSQFMRPAGQGPVGVQDGALIAGAPLESLLNTGLAADAKAGDTLAVGLSFRDTEGDYCRTFTVQQGHTLGGLACRNGGQWRVVALGEAHRQGSELRQAASDLPASVLAEVDARQREMLDAAAERAARDAGWR